MPTLIDKPIPSTIDSPIPTPAHRRKITAVDSNFVLRH
jgi:hypothetical protein